MKLRYLVIVTILLLGTSCKKFSEKRSFEKTKNLMINRWDLDKFFLNGKNVTGSFVRFFALFTEKDGTYEMGINGTGFFEFQEAGTWEISADKKFLILHFKAAGPNNGLNGTGPQQAGDEEWEILLLKTGILHLKQVQPNGDIWEVQLETYHCC